jgi:hypothetical protein
MLTIENIDKLKADGFKSKQLLRVAGEKWELTEIQTGRDVYQFVYRCIESNPTTIGTKVLGREAIIDLYRENTMVDLGLGVNVYELKCITNGKSRLVGLPDLKAPGALIGPMLRVIEGS